MNKKKKKTNDNGVVKTVALIRKYASPCEKTKNREECVEKILAHFKKEGITKNSKGFPITKESVAAQINNTVRGIQQKNRGWCSEYDVVENENEFKFVKKEKFI